MRWVSGRVDALYKAEIELLEPHEPQLGFVGVLHIERLVYEEIRHETQ
jgi:hypothetical protein